EDVARGIGGSERFAAEKPGEGGGFAEEDLKLLPVGAVAGDDEVNVGPTGAQCEVAVGESFETLFAADAAGVEEGGAAGAEFGAAALVASFRPVEGGVDPVLEHLDPADLVAAGAQGERRRVGGNGDDGAALVELADHHLDEVGDEGVAGEDLSVLC